MKLEFSRQIFEIYSHIKFNENPSIGSRVVPRGQTVMKKLIVAFAAWWARLKVNVYHWLDDESTVLLISNGSGLILNGSTVRGVRKIAKNDY